MSKMNEYLVDGEELMVRMYEAATRTVRPEGLTPAQALDAIHDPEQVQYLRLAAQAAFEYVMECTQGFGKIAEVTRQ